MLSFYRPILALATVLAAASCAAPDTAETSPEPVTDSAPPVEAEASSGGTSCTLSTTCWSGRVQGHCAKSPASCGTMCCTGCVDSQGICRDGSSTDQCGGGGQACVECERGKECSAGACSSSCSNPGTSCMYGGVPGVYANNPSGSCVCCTGCLSANGVCTNGDEDILCGHGGAECENCGTWGTCSSGSCSAVSNPCFVNDDCPAWLAGPCQVVACDPTGHQTAAGSPVVGCYAVAAPSGTSCTLASGCPGQCQFANGVSTCQ